MLCREHNLGNAEVVDEVTCWRFVVSYGAPLNHSDFGFLHLHSLEHSWLSGLSWYHQETSGISHWTSPVTFNIVEESYWAWGLNTNQNTPKNPQIPTTPFFVYSPCTMTALGVWADGWFYIQQEGCGAVEKHQALLPHSAEDAMGDQSGSALRSHRASSASGRESCSICRRCCISKCCLCSDGSQRSWEQLYVGVSIGSHPLPVGAWCHSAAGLAVDSTDGAETWRSLGLVCGSASKSWVGPDTELWPSFVAFWKGIGGITQRKNSGRKCSCHSAAKPGVKMATNWNYCWRAILR